MPTAAGLHQWGSALCAKQQRAGVDVHRPIPAFGALLHRRTVEARSRVVNKNIQPAEGTFSFIEELVQTVNVADIGFDDQRATAQGFNFGSRFFSRGAVTKKVDNHIRTALGKMQGNGAPNAAARAGDEGDFIFEIGFRFHVLGLLQ